jgi:hypothetical protein
MNYDDFLLLPIEKFFITILFFPDLFELSLLRKTIFLRPSNDVLHKIEFFYYQKGEIYSKLYSLLMLISLRRLPKSNKVLKWFLRKTSVEGFPKWIRKAVQGGKCQKSITLDENICKSLLNVKIETLTKFSFNFSFFLR